MYNIIIHVDTKNLLQNTKRRLYYTDIRSVAGRGFNIRYNNIITRHNRIGETGRSRYAGRKCIKIVHPQKKKKKKVLLVVTLRIELKSKVVLVKKKIKYFNSLSIGI